MPEPPYKSSLPVGCMAPVNIEEVALRIESTLAVSGEDWFRHIPTGFPEFDRLLGGGLHAGDLHLVGGPQNIGNTSLTLQMAAAIAGAGALALVVNYEHSVETLWERLLCQSAFIQQGETTLTTAELMDAYVSTVRERVNGRPGNGGAAVHFLDQVLARVPSGLAAWDRLSEAGNNIWLVTGDGVYTTVDSLRHYLDFAFTVETRVVLIVDYVQEVPVISTVRPLAAEERIERVLAGLKSLALGFRNEGKVLSVIAVAAADAEGLRKGRIHLENLWGNATIQYKPDVAWIGNRDADNEDGDRSVRWAVEKNRRGPSDLEFRHVYYGPSFTFERVGEPVPSERSWQSERTNLVD